MLSVIMVFSFAACAGKSVNNEGESQTEETTTIRIGAMAGPTAMGMVKLRKDSENGNTKNTYAFEDFAIDASAFVTPLATGEIDIAAVPSNLAANIYNKTEGKVQVVAVNTLGVLYMVESGDTIHSAEDLRGKTIYASGKGATPEYALNYILEQNGIDPAKDVTIEWKSEHSECVAALNASENAIAMLPQPFVTTAQSKNSNLRVALDLTEEWDKLQENAESPSTLVTGVVVARTEFIEQNPQAVEDFLKHYQESVDYVNKNVNEGAALVGKYDIVTEAVAQKAIPECNITFISGNEMKEKLSGYLSVLNDQNAKSIGGKLPADEFHYNA